MKENILKEIYEIINEKFNINGRILLNNDTMLFNYVKFFKARDIVYLIYLICGTYNIQSDKLCLFEKEVTINNIADYILDNIELQHQTFV